MTKNKKNRRKRPSKATANASLDGEDKKETSLSASSNSKFSSRSPLTDNKKDNSTPSLATALKPSSITASSTAKTTEPSRSSTNWDAENSPSNESINRDSHTEISSTRALVPPVVTGNEGTASSSSSITLVTIGSDATTNLTYSNTMSASSSSKIKSHAMNSTVAGRMLNTSSICCEIGFIAVTDYVRRAGIINEATATCLAGGLTFVVSEYNSYHSSKRLHEQMEASKEETHNTARENKRMKREYAAIKLERDDIRAELIENQNHLTSKTRQIEKLERDGKKMKRNLEANRVEQVKTKTKLAEATAGLEIKAAESNDLMEELEMTRNQRDDATTAAASLTAEHDKILNDLNTTREELANTEQECDDLKATIENMKKQTTLGEMISEFNKNFT